MSPKVFASSALCLVLGVGIGVGVRPSKSAAVEPPDMYAGAIRLVEVADSDAPVGRPTDYVTITPYRVEENGRSRQLGEPGEGRRWVLHVDGGRVKVMGTSGR